MGLHDVLIVPENNTNTAVIYDIYMSRNFLVTSKLSASHAESHTHTHIPTYIPIFQGGGGGVCHCFAHTHILTYIPIISGGLPLFYKTTCKLPVLSQTRTGKEMC